MGKVTKFPITEDSDEPEYVVQFPDMPTIQSMLAGAKLDKVLVLTINANGDASHYIDGATTLEALGMVEMLKTMVFLNDQTEDS